jgi:hypothetical protein
VPWCKIKQCAEVWWQYSTKIDTGGRGQNLTIILKMDIKEIGLDGGEWIYLYQWWGERLFVNLVMKIWIYF